MRERCACYRTTRLLTSFAAPIHSSSTPCLASFYLQFSVHQAPTQLHLIYGGNPCRWLNSCWDPSREFSIMYMSLGVAGNPQRMDMTSNIQHGGFVACLISLMLFLHDRELAHCFTDCSQSKRVFQVFIWRYWSIIILSPREYGVPREPTTRAEAFPLMYSCGAFQGRVAGSWKAHALHRIFVRKWTSNIDVPTEFRFNELED